MRLPYVNSTQKSITFTSQFRGYYHQLARADGNGRDDETTFYDMKNMSLKHYPVICTRSGRKLRTLARTVPSGKNYVTTFSAGSNLVVANGTSLQFGNFDSGFTTIAAIDNSRKTFASIGAKVLMLPDGLVFNTHNLTVEYVRQSVDKINTSLDITPCILGDDGNYSTITYVSQTTAPTDTSVYWYDTQNKQLKKYSTVSYSWVGIGTAFLKVTASSSDTELKALFGKISAWDTLSFTRLLCSNSYKQEELDKIAKNDGEDGKGDNVIYGTGSDYVVISGFVTSPITVTSYKIERRMPDMDFITSLNNRIWGCSSANHEIYACKLGDPTQWYNYPGIASDSYAATIGSFGDFTGATSLNSYALFFKENSMFKVYGDYPSNFQVVEIVCDGVEKGSERSIQEIGGILYYKGINGMMLYDGSIPSPFTDVFGDVKYSYAVAGAIQNKYYINMLSSEDLERWLFCYDTETGFWTKEDNVFYSTMMKYKNQIVAVDSNEYMYTFPEDSDYDDDDEEIEWMVTTRNLGLASPMQKYISRVQLRMDVVGQMRILISYNDGEFREVFHRRSDSLRSFTIPINVKRCDHFRIRMEGVGHIELYSYGYQVEHGSDRTC